MALWLFNSSGKALSCLRQFVTSSAFNSQPSDIKPTEPKPGSPGSDNVIRKRTALTGLQRWALVFSGKYKTKADVPQYVSHEVLEKARSKARIKLANILMVLTLVACLSYAYSGRKAAERGESVQQMNIDWHKEYEAQAARQKEEVKSK